MASTARQTARAEAWDPSRATSRVEFRCRGAHSPRGRCGTPPAGPADGVVPEGHLPHDGAAAGQRALEVRALVAHDLRAGPEAPRLTLLKAILAPLKISRYKRPLSSAAFTRGATDAEPPRGSTLCGRWARDGPRDRAPGADLRRPVLDLCPRPVRVAPPAPDETPYWRSRGLDRSRADVAGAGPRGAGVAGGSEQRGVRAPRGSHCRWCAEDVRVL